LSDGGDQWVELLGESAIRIEIGAGRLARLGALATTLGVRRALLVTDAGIRAAGHVDRAVASLDEMRVSVAIFDGALENPTTEQVDAGVNVAQRLRPDLIIGLGGGSVMDCAKGINLLYSLGGRVEDHRGDPPPDVLAGRAPLLTMILVPTTAGTGSEAQSFALISDAATRQKMACGDRRPPGAGGLRPAAAILDADLTRTAPAAVTAAAGVDAISHAVETAATTARTEASRRCSTRAWRLLSVAFERVLRTSDDSAGREAMLIGAHLAGMAIEHSMLGAAHACGNPLTARFGVVHGVAVGLMLPHVIRFNCDGRSNPYSDLAESPAALLNDLERLLGAAGIPRWLAALGLPEAALPELAELAAGQWTARFNPRPLGQAEALQLYRSAYG
jgi:alcohol dehydrogenase